MTLGWEGFEQVSGKSMRRSLKDGLITQMQMAQRVPYLAPAGKHSKRHQSRARVSLILTLRSMKPEGTSALHD